MKIEIREWRLNRKKFDGRREHGIEIRKSGVMGLADVTTIAARQANLLVMVREAKTMSDLLRVLAQTV